MQREVRRTIRVAHSRSAHFILAALKGQPTPPALPNGGRSESSDTEPSQPDEFDLLLYARRRRRRRPLGHAVRRRHCRSARAVAKQQRYSRCRHSVQHGSPLSRARQPHASTQTQLSDAPTAATTTACCMATTFVGFLIDLFAIASLRWCDQQVSSLEVSRSPGGGRSPHCRSESMQARVPQSSQTTSCQTTLSTCKV